MSPCGVTSFSTGDPVNLVDPSGHRVTYGCEDSPGGCNSNGEDACDAQCQARGAAEANAERRRWANEQLQALRHQEDALSCNFFCALGEEAWSGITSPFTQGIHFDQDAFSASAQIKALLKAGHVKDAQALEARLAQEFADYNFSGSFGGQVFNFGKGVVTTVASLPGDIANGDFSATEHDVARLTLAAGSIAGLKGAFGAPEAAAAAATPETAAPPAPPPVTSAALSRAPASFFLPTHDLSGAADWQLVGDIQRSMEREGWQGDPIAVAQYNNDLYILDGHHRVAAALRAGIEVPYQLYDLPAFGYNNIFEVISAWSQVGPR